MTAEALESRVHLCAGEAESFQSGNVVAPAAVTAAAQAGVPAAPFRLAGGFAPLRQVRLTWLDMSSDESGFLVRRRGANDASFTDVATVPANTTEYVDTLPAPNINRDPMYYEVVAFNDAGQSAAARTLVCWCDVFGGLRERIWNPLDLTTNTDNQAVGAPKVGEPTDQAITDGPDYDNVDPIVDDGYGSGAPQAGVPADSFGIEWVGEIVAEETKAYTFSIVSDDGSRLFLDGKLAISNWRDQGDTETFSGPVSLTAGQHVKVRMQMYENGGGATARLRWNGPGDVREAVPTAFLLPTVSADDTVANVPLRAPTFPSVFAMPGNPTTATANAIDVAWQDNAFGEAGYEVQRATNAGFTADVLDFPLVRKGSNIFVDDGAVSPIDPSTTYYYRVRTAGTATWVYAGSARINDFYTYSTDLTLKGFTPQNSTVNGFATHTLAGPVTLTEEQNDRSGSVFVNRAFNIADDFDAQFDVRMTAGSGADGMAFIIQNSLPANSPNARTQVKGLGGGGGSKGYAGGFPNSVALLFDFYNNIDQIGVYTNNANSGDGAANYVNDPAAWPLQPNGTINLRAAPITAQGGTGTIDLNSNTIWRVRFSYDLDDAGTPQDPGDDTGTVTVEMRRADAAAGSAPLVRTQYAVNLAQVIGSNTAAMGFSAATGGVNSKQEVLNFEYGRVEPPPPPGLTDVHVAGDAWSTAFKSYLAAKGLGDANYGYRLVSNGVPVAGPAADPDQILPWINMNQLVLKFSTALSDTGIWAPGGVVFTSQQGVQYIATAVTPVAGDPAALVVTLNQPLGGGKPVFGLPPTAQENGDRITVSVRGEGVNGTDFSLRMNVLQGDADHTGEAGIHSVLAADFSAVKKKFFTTTTDGPTGTDTDYSPFHDVNGDGQILANDFSEVRKRFFQQVPPPPPAALASAVPPPVGTRRLRPASRDLLG